MSWDGSRPMLYSGTQNSLRWGSVPYLSHAWLLPPRRAAHTEPRAREQWEASLLQEAPGGLPPGQRRSGHLLAPRPEAPSARHREGAPPKANVDEGRKARTRRPRRRGADDRPVSSISGTRSLTAAARMRAQVGSTPPPDTGALGGGATVPPARPAGPPRPLGPRPPEAPPPRDRPARGVPTPYLTPPRPRAPRALLPAPDTRPRPRPWAARPPGRPRLAPPARPCPARPRRLTWAGVARGCAPLALGGRGGAGGGAGT